MEDNRLMDLKPRFDQYLTKRELEICGMIAKGLSSEKIAKLLFLSEGTVKNYITSIYQKKGVKNRAELAATYALEYEQAETDIDMFESTNTDNSEHIDAVLRLVGLNGLPDVIPLRYQGVSFTIGRFDVSVGRKQCDFEFSKETKAVSRRHASIEHTFQGYVVKDLDSRAGTYINGRRIMPGEHCPIKNGDQISFGNAGAEYVFEG